MDRYVIRESTGYTILPSGRTTERAPLTTEVLVLDSQDCYHVVWSSISTPMPQQRRRANGIKKGVQTVTARTWTLEKRRAYARDLASRLNAEDAAA